MHAGKKMLLDATQQPEAKPMIRSMFISASCFSLALLLGSPCFAQAEPDNRASQDKRQADGERARRGQNQDARGGRSNFGRSRRGGQTHPLLAALDTNGDGEISKEELANATKSLARLDKNNDGKLGKNEIQPSSGPARNQLTKGGRRPSEGNAGKTRRTEFNAEQYVKRMMSMDKDGNGKLAKTEVPERLQQNFARADEDGDGFLSIEEVTRIADVVTRRAAQGGQGSSSKRPQGGAKKKRGMDKSEPSEPGGTKPKRPGS